ncbi:MFS transporter [Lacticaseibacillus paracasei]|uniref:MFS transporter n=1 Tax=Lacticaseibacillus paracasei TaxID=1597 RepID=UPI00189C30AE|nr:MFS transporter [Lacticaseibacillus paracasei]
MATSTSKFSRVMLIISLLALNIVEQSASAISGAIPGMAASFPNQSSVQIELITTVVSVSVTIFVLVSGFVSRWIGQKQTAILGLVIAAVSSVIPAMSNSFNVIMISRAILGIGIGLANPLAISLIGEFFEGDTLATLMGWRSAVASIGVSAMTFFAGQLLQVNWHAAFWVYLLFVPTLILFIIFVPTPELDQKTVIDQDQDSTAEASETSKVPENKHLGLIIALALLVLVYMGSAMISYIKMATMFVETGIGTPTQASSVISVVGLAQLVGGALFGIAFKYLKQYILPIGVGLSGLMMVLMTFSSNILVITIFGGLSGVFGGMAVPYIFTKVSMVSSTKSAPLNNALILVGTNLGSFIAPMLASVLGATALLSLRNAGWLIVALTVIIVIALIVTQNRSKQQLAK